ncbi:MAG: hypothetical protein QM767_20130 [Anaeromyxobacter sp.]
MKRSRSAAAASATAARRRSATVAATRYCVEMSIPRNSCSAGPTSKPSPSGPRKSRVPAKEMAETPSAAAVVPRVPKRSAPQSMTGMTRYSCASQWSRGAKKTSAADPVVAAVAATASSARPGRRSSGGTGRPHQASTVPATSSVPSAEPADQRAQSRPNPWLVSSATATAPIIPDSVVQAKAATTISTATSRSRDMEGRSPPAARCRAQAPSSDSAELPAKKSSEAQTGCPCSRLEARLAGSAAATTQGQARRGQSSSGTRYTPLAGQKVE